MIDIADQERSFFLQSIDTPSGFVISEIGCGQFRFRDIETCVGISTRDLNDSQGVKLAEEDVDRLKAFFDIEFIPMTDETRLYSWSDRDGLPYRIHAPRELVLMLSNKKPLTFLYGRIPENTSFIEIPEYLFDPFVESGEFSKIEYCERNMAGYSSIRGLRIVLYALRGEEWRMRAYMMLRDLANKIGWSEPLTRLEGNLLGYTELENEAYSAFTRDSRHFQD